MKNGLIVLAVMLLSGCEEFPTTNDLNVDPDLLIEYNVILHDALKYPICGGTVIKSTTKKTRIITAGHCINGAIYNILYGGDPTMYIMPQNGKLYPVKIFDYEPIFTDIAILETVEDPIPLQRKANLLPYEPNECDFIWTLGLGGGEPDAFSFGIVSKTGVVDHYGRTMNQFDCTVWYGNSGGGIFNSDGKLVGVVSQMGPQFHEEPETGWMYGTTVTHMREVLTRN